MITIQLKRAEDITRAKQDKDPVDFQNQIKLHQDQEKLNQKQFVISHTTAHNVL